MLSQENIQGNWKQIKGGIRNVWGKITDNEIEQYKGNLEEILGVIQEKYSESKEEIKEKFDKLMNSFDNDTDKHISKDESSFERRPYGDDFEDRHP